MATTTPKRRASDRGWHSLVRENWYRDVWLVVVTGLLVWALASIQNERWNNVYRNCQSSNERYLATQAKLDEVIRKAPEDRRKQAQASRTQTLEFVATIVPTHFDAHGRSTCRQVADQQVNRFP